MSDSLTLYDIDRNLMELLDFRAERSADAAEPPSEEEIAAVDGEIRRCLGDLAKKVDGVGHMITHLRDQAELASKEIDRLRARKAHFETNLARLKGYVAEILERQPEPAKGSKKLVGAHTTLALRTNGGVAPLVIDSPELIPPECCYAEVTMPWPMWVALNENGLEGILWRDIDLVEAKRVPNNALIRKALEQPCFRCGGIGVVDELRTLDEIGQCPACGGTGLSGVAGAHLGDRGKSVKVL